jgi:hypothetical protein
MDLYGEYLLGSGSYTSQVCTMNILQLFLSCKHGYKVQIQTSSSLNEYTASCILIRLRIQNNLNG